MAALRDLGSDRLSVRVVDHIDELFSGKVVPELAAIDIPIGLMDTGSRACDVAARVLLKGRASTVFPAPNRPVLSCATYAEANLRSKEQCGAGLSAQAFNIMPKIAEVDHFARNGGHGLVREAHPELAFVRMNGSQRLGRSKHDWAGLIARGELLRGIYGKAVEGLESSIKTYRRVAPDDLYDALALLETARRISLGIAQRVPEPPPTDSCGLPMEIWY